jgi:hypothetical protein
MSTPRLKVFGSARAFSRSMRRANSNSGWPAADSKRAVASPMPELAPVMMINGLLMVELLR